jgi:membrane associated rhomboid family serine protease
LQQPRVREPIFTAPWPAVLLAASIPASFAVQQQLFTPEQAGARFGLSTSALFRGDGAGLITALWVHGFWAHALVNAAFALVCGAAVARLLGRSLPRALSFFAFYLVCGAIANGLCALVTEVFSPGQVLIGASGAVSGLVGAAARTLDRRGKLGPVLSRTTVAIACLWTASNVVVALGLDPAATAHGPIAWTAHLFGFFAGLLLIGPWSRLFGERSDLGALDFPRLVDR